MDTTEPADAIDEIRAEVDENFPDLDLIGLPVVGRVLRLARVLDARREAQLADFGLTAADFDVLASLRRKAVAAPIKVRELQRSLMLSSGGMTKRLDRLETTGLLERLRDPDDRRGVLIALTDAGRQLIDRALPAVLRVEDELVADALDDRLRQETEAGLRRLLLANDNG